MQSSFVSASVTALLNKVTVTVREATKIDMAVWEKVLDNLYPCSEDD